MNEVPFHLCFDTLANELRIRIMKELEHHPRSVMDLSGQLGEEQSKISHALRVLRECQYVEVHPRGKQRIYSLKKGAAFPAVKNPLEEGLGLIHFMENHANSICIECRKTGKGGKYGPTVV